ncbi:MAG: TIGR00341 family protein [Spirochaetes bacterium GWC1_27_15]|nr:MAG: TIGR00341 family protein [Spirochaetes bacterium GWC1_27_15]
MNTDNNNTDQNQQKEIKEKNLFSFVFEKFKKEGKNPFSKGIKSVFDEYNDYKIQTEKIKEKYIYYENVISGGKDTIEYYILLILSCLIATFGLYTNSTATIIGAMIVAPLMGPIFGFSAGVLWGNTKDILSSIFTLLKGIVIVLLITSSITFIIPFIKTTNEMLARGNPSLADILVALASGLIGAYSFVNKRISSAIPGVAIAVALMPPLCTTGIGIGLRNFNLAFGALSLFSINLVSISLASIIVFYLVQLHPQLVDSKSIANLKTRFIRHILIAVFLLILISTPIVIFLSITIAENKLNYKISNVINNNKKDNKIYNLNIKKLDKTNYFIELIFLSKTNNLLEENKIKIELEEAIKKTVDLQIYYIFTKPEEKIGDTTTDG